MTAFLTASRNFNVGMHSDVCYLVSWRLGLMVVTSILYILIVVMSGLDLDSRPLGHKKGKKSHSQIC